jgi:hypothetical protein
LQENRKFYVSHFQRAGSHILTEGAVVLAMKKCNSLPAGLHNVLTNKFHAQPIKVPVFIMSSVTTKNLNKGD